MWIRTEQKEKKRSQAVYHLTRQDMIPHNGNDDDYDNDDENNNML